MDRNLKIENTHLSMHSLVKCHPVATVITPSNRDEFLCECTYILYGTTQAPLLPNNCYANSMVVLLSNLAMMRYNQSLKAQLWGLDIADDHIFAHPYCK